MHPPIKYRPEIDGLRAIAVLSVIVHHAFPNLLPGGFVGVDIFFVISGYLITGIIMRDVSRVKFGFLDFYCRRIIRIMPSLIAVLAAILIISWWVLFNNEYYNIIYNVIFSIIFSENLFLWSQVGYFDIESKFKPTLHIWSLSVEEQYYLFWPLVVSVFFGRRWGLVLAGLFLTTFFISLWYSFNDPVAAYYSPFSRGWELLIGSILAYLEIRRPGIFSKMENLFASLGIGLIALSLAVISEEKSFPGLWALLPTLGAAFLIASGGGSWINRNFLSARLMVAVGLISYPLYLWHWPALSFGRIIFGPLSLAEVFILIVLAFFASILTYYLVERPFRLRLLNGWEVPLLLAGAGGILVMSTLMATGVILPRLHAMKVPVGTSWDVFENQPAFSSVNKIGTYVLGADRRNKVFLIGDSHLAHYGARIDEIIKTDPQSLGATFAMGGGCIPLLNVHVEGDSRRGCAGMIQAAFQLAQIGEAKNVGIVGAWNWYFTQVSDYFFEENGRIVPLNTPEGLHLAMVALETEIRSLVQAGKTVFVVLDGPWSQSLFPSAAKLRLLAGSARFQPNATIPASPEQSALNERMKAVVINAGGIPLDAYSALCGSGACRITDAEGNPVFLDPSHYNPQWARGQAGFIDRALYPSDASPQN